MSFLEDLGTLVDDVECLLSSYPVFAIEEKGDVQRWRLHIWVGEIST